MSRMADELGDRPRGVPPAKLHPAGPVSRIRRKVALQYDSGNYEPALDKALHEIGYAQAARRAGGAARAGSLSRHRLLDLPRGVRPRAVEGGRQPRRAGRPMGERRGPGHAHRQDRSADRDRTATARAMKRRSPRSSPTSCRCRWPTSPSSMATPARCRSAGAPTAAAVRPSGSRRSRCAADKIRDKATRIGAHLLEAAVEDVEYVDGAFRVKGVPDRTQVVVRRLAAGAPVPQHARRARARTRGEPLLRSEQFRLSLRHPHRGRRSGCRHGAHDAAALRRGRRLRPADQPDDRRGPAARRHRPRHGAGAPRGRPLRRSGPAHERLVPASTRCRAPTTCRRSSWITR